MSSEKQPHIVYVQGDPRATPVIAFLFPDYAQAFAYWKAVHTYKTPYLLATVGRHCTPAAEIVDVNE